MGLGYSGSSLSSWLVLSPANLLYRKDFSLSQTWGWRDLVSIQGSQSASWRLEGVKVWKLSRAYLGEKPPPFSLPMQGSCFQTRKPIQHLLTISNIPVEWDPFMMVWLSFQLHIPRSYGDIFAKKIKIS